MKRKVLCGFLFLMFAIVFSGCGGKNSDLSNSVEATYSPSYNGYATAEISFNEEKLDKLINNKKAIKVVEKAAEDNFLIEAIYELALESDEDAFAFDDFFNIVVESDLKKLSNGDMINFRIQANSDFLPSEDMTTVEFAKELGFNIERFHFQY